MSIRIQVTRAEAQTISGTSKAGKAYSFRKQACWAFLADRKGIADEHPTRIEVMLDDEAAPYPVGFYTLAPASFYAGAFGALECSPRLVPLQAK